MKLTYEIENARKVISNTIGFMVKKNNSLTLLDFINETQTKL
jgi:hypothetical protein